MQSEKQDVNESETEEYHKMEQHKEMEIPLEEKRLEIELQIEYLTAVNRQNEKTRGDEKMKSKNQIRRWPCV